MMTRDILRFSFAALLCASTACFAQAPAGAPTGATGQCKDGTYTTNPNKAKACKGHQGVKSWYQTVGGQADPDIKGGTGTQSSNSKKAAQSDSVVNPHSADAQVSGARAHAINKKSGNAVVATPENGGKTEAGPAVNGTAAANGTAVAGGTAASGGPGVVWVNTQSKVYHCYGSSTYGKTKNGKYMSEQQARKMGARPDHGKACSAQ